LDFSGFSGVSSFSQTHFAALELRDLCLAYSRPCNFNN